MAINTSEERYDDVVDLEPRNDNFEELGPEVN